MTIILNGTTGITTPDVTSSGSLNIDASAPDNSLVVNASGNVGVGTSSPTARLDVEGAAASNNLAIKINNTDTSGYSTLQMGGTDAGIYRNGSTQGSYGGNSSLNIITVGAHNIGFATNNTERARIDSSGNLLVGRTGQINQERFGYTTTTDVGAIFQRANDTQFYPAIFNTSNGLVGYIYSSGSSTSYNTSSDYRLKEDWQPMTGASERVKALKPVNFAWKADGSRVDGFLAHEAQAVVPEAVHGEKDAVELVDIKDEEGNVTGQEERPVYQGIDQSKLVPLLTAALQEALAEIDDLTARVSALEATNV